MAGQKTYKRSWKNLLLNKRYQLRFTLFMVGLSAVLMAGLGVWVMKEANDATTIGKNSVVGNACPKVPELNTQPSDEPDTTVPMKLDGSDTGDAPTDPKNAPAPDATVPKMPKSSVDPKDVATHNAMDDLIAVTNQWCISAVCKPGRAEPLQIKVAKCDAYIKKKLDDPDAVAVLRAALIPIVKCEGGQSFSVADAPEHHVKVQIDESSMTLTPEAPKVTIPKDYPDIVVAHWACEMSNATKMDALDRGRLHILWVLIATGIAMVIGLAFYGIKMTHKVAGPLFKISLYLAKMKDGRLDKVYNLRKGDQLVDFYDHFKAAHAGVVKLEQDDITQIKSLIAAAEASGAGEHEAVAELKTLLQRKEKSLE